VVSVSYSISIYETYEQLLQEVKNWQ